VHPGEAARDAPLAIPFARHEGAAVWLAVALFVLVFAVRLVVHGAEPVEMFLIFPVALLAMAFGVRIGLLAGLVGAALTVASVSLQGFTPSALGWLGRVVPILLLGVLVGWTRDRETSAAQIRQALFEAQLREREAAELNDSIVQHLAVAKWMMESGRADAGLELLSATISASESLVAALLGCRPLPRAPVVESAASPRDARA
jgi:hypothetical protein